MNDVLLIELVHRHQELYDTTHKKYCDNFHKENIWRAIALELRKTPPECKTRWVSLRDQLRKALKKKKRKVEQGAGSVRQWKYEPNMSFLFPFLKERDTASCLLSTVEYSDDDVGDRLGGETTDADDTDDKSFVHLRGMTQVSETPTPKDEIKDEASANSSGQSVDPIDAFFAGLAATVKQFSPYYQNLAKSRLFAVISDLELLQILHRSESLHQYVGHAGTFNSAVVNQSGDARPASVNSDSVHSFCGKSSPKIE